MMMVMMVIYDNSITFFFDTFENTLLIVTNRMCFSVYVSSATGSVHLQLEKSSVGFSAN